MAERNRQSKIMCITDARQIFRSFSFSDFNRLPKIVSRGNRGVSAPAVLIASYSLLPTFFFNSALVSGPKSLIVLLAVSFFSTIFFMKGVL